jgi:hypothetical protein
MKLFGKIILVIVVLLLLAMFSIPFLFKGKIEETAKEQANQNLEAVLEFSDIKLSMFKNFPNLSVEINNIIITGKGVFAQDTIAHIKSMGAGVNLASLISGGPIKTNAIYIKGAEFNAIINEDEQVNWDIFKVSTEAEATTTTEDSDSSMPEIIFEKIFFHDINISYKDLVEKTTFIVEDINIDISGNFSEKNTNIDFSLSTPNTNLKYGGINYLKNTELLFKAIIGADLSEYKFTFKENKLKVNDLEMNLEGICDVNDKDIVVDLKLNSKDNDFKSILSLIPGEFQKDIKDIQTSGSLSLSASAKGSYKENHYPAFNANLKIANAKVKYPDLPESVNNINVNVDVSNPGGDPDNTVTNVSKLHFDIAKNPFDFKMLVKTPISDPALDGSIKGIIDFAKLKNAIPMEEISIAGRVNANVLFKGNMSYINKGEYEKFTSKGNISLKNFKFNSKDMPKAFEVKNSLLTFSSRQISLKKFNANMGKSDFSLRGTIRNFFPYIFKNKTLYGNFYLNSNKLDINELMTESTTTSTDTTEDSALSVIEIPKNLNISLNSNIKSILYDKLIISNTTGKVEINKSKANLKNLKMYMLKGDVKMNGVYDASSKKNPAMNIAFDVNNFDIRSAWQSFSIIKKTIPMAMNAAGKISLDFNLTSRLNSKMEIIPSTMNGGGRLNSQGIIINENKMLDQLALLAKDNSLRRVSISQLNIDFLIKNGNIQVKPFKTKIAGYPATIFGNQDVKGNINYTIAGKVDKKVLGSKMLSTFNRLPGFKNINTLDVDVHIGGTLDKPTVKPDLNKVRKQIQKAAEKELKKKAEKELLKGLKKLFR